MGKSNRQWAKDKLRASTNSATSAMAHLEPVIKTYEEHHPEIAQMLTMAQLVMAEARDLVVKIDNSF